MIDAVAAAPLWSLRADRARRVDVRPSGDPNNGQRERTRGTARDRRARQGDRARAGRGRDRAATTRSVQATRRRDSQARGQRVDKSNLVQPHGRFGTDTVKDNDVVPPTGIRGHRKRLRQRRRRRERRSRKHQKHPDPDNTPTQPQPTDDEARSPAPEFSVPTSQQIVAHPGNERAAPRPQRQRRHLRRARLALFDAPASADRAIASPRSRCTRRTIPLATHRSPASRSVPAIAPQRNGIGLASACGLLGFARRREETSLSADEQVRRRQALETRFGVTTVLRAGPPTRALPLPTRGSVDGPHARALASRPKCHGVLAEIETAPPRADCSSRGTGLPRGAFGGVVTRLQLRVGSHGPGWCAGVAASEA